MGNSLGRRPIGCRFGWCVLMGAALFLAAQARAANKCPWLNEATASGLLGGAATGTYIDEAGRPKACTFTERSAKLVRTLQVSVETVRDPHSRLISMVGATCGLQKASPIQAIGNEAVGCAYDSHNVKRGWHVLGRVRDQIFVISLGSSIKNDPVLTPDMTEMKSETAAAQISGNLF